MIVQDKKTNYRVYRLKKGKKIRKIVTYLEGSELRTTHETINNYLKEHVKYSKFTKAYKKGTSIFDNAKLHMYNDIFLQFDIKNFFPSINHSKLVDILFKELNRESNIISKRECYEVVSISSQNLKGLPLGFITSPLLSNLYLKQFDNLVYGRLKKEALNNIIYTRYADDITISFKNGLYDLNEVQETITNILCDLLKSFNLKLNNKKTKLTDITKSNHVKITGVYVTRRLDNYRHLSVGRKLRKELIWKAIQLYEKQDRRYEQVQEVKGLYSFILSIHKEGFDNILSPSIIRILDEKKILSIDQLIREL